MSSSQDPTSPTTGGPPRTDRGEVEIRPPMLWIYGTGIALCFTGGPIVLVGLYYNMRSWEATGILLMMLFASAIIAIPGVLAAIRHPWATGFGSLLTERHPRLGGLVQVWVGLILFGVTLVFGAELFGISLPFFDTWYRVVVIYIVMLLGGIVPVATVRHFDRHR